MQEIKGRGKKSKKIQLPNIEHEVQPILDALPFYVLLVDSEHRIISANSAVRRDFGLSPEQLAGTYCPMVVHGCSNPIEECPLKEAFKTGKAVEKEIFESRSNRWLNTGVYPTSMATPGGKPIYLHFARDITDIKKLGSELSRNFEHHKALCDLLQSLQRCQDSAQIFETLIDQVISLSWLGVAATAVGFLVKGKGLEMISQRNVSAKLLERCRTLNLGECLCGKVAEIGRGIVSSSASNEHTIRYNGMVEHQHVVMPLSYESRVLGILTLYLNPGDKMDPFRFGFLEAAVAAASAALAAQLAREEVKRTREKSMAQVITSQEDERKRVARDLHEQLGQSLSALLLHVQSQRMEDESAQRAQQDCEVRIRDLIDQVRQMAKQLRPSILDDYGLESALNRQLEELSARVKLPIDFQYVSSPEQNGRLPDPIEVALYRVALEALSNVIAHAHASRASVIIEREHGKVMLLIEDDGCGFDYAAVRKDIDRCLGLIGMEERISLLGGELRIESSPHKGTTVRAEIPIDG